MLEILHKVSGQQLCTVYRHHRRIEKGSSRSIPANRRGSRPAREKKDGWKNQVDANEKTRRYGNTSERERERE